VAKSANRTGTVQNCPENGALQDGGAHEQETMESSFLATVPDRATPG
jgi:hypothetical protein